MFGTVQKFRISFVSVLAVLGCMSFAQTPGATVQAGIDAAIAAGQTTYRLPAGQISLTESIVIPAGTKNLTILGASGTRLVRTNTADYPLIRIGDGSPYGYDNSSFSRYSSFAANPAAEGDTTITTTGIPPTQTGWYAIIGTHSLNDIVTHSNGVQTYWFKRELIRVTGINGNVLTIDQPLGRDFGNPELRLVSPDGAIPSNRFVAENITLRDFSIAGRSTVNNGMVQKAVVACMVQNLTLDDLTITGFVNTAVSVQFGKGITATKLRISDGNLSSLGYGLEFMGTRMVTVRNCTFSTIRCGTIFQSGNMDALIEDVVATSNVVTGLDGGHGTGDKRITFRRCLATNFNVANPSYRRGTSDVTIEDCTALDGFSIYGGAKNVVIRGMYPGQTMTGTVIRMFTDSGGSGVPQGLSYVESLTLENGATVRGVLDGVNTQLLSITNTPPALGTLTIRNWSFKNTVSNTGAALFLNSTSIPSNVIVENSRLENTYLYSAPILINSTTGAGRFNLVLKNNRFVTTGRHALMIMNAANVAVADENGNTYNGAQLQNTQVYGAFQVGMRP